MGLSRHFSQGLSFAKIFFFERATFWSVFVLKRFNVVEKHMADCPYLRNLAGRRWSPISFRSSLCPWLGLWPKGVPTPKAPDHTRVCLVRFSLWISGFSSFVVALHSPAEPTWRSWSKCFPETMCRKKQRSHTPWGFLFWRVFVGRGGGCAANQG